jgi:hypothetical protein
MNWALDMAAMVWVVGYSSVEVLSLFFGVVFGVERLEKNIRCNLGSGAPFLKVRCILCFFRKRQKHKT